MDHLIIPQLILVCNLLSFEHLPLGVVLSCDEYVVASCQRHAVLFQRENSNLVQELPKSLIYDVVSLHLHGASPDG